MATLLEERSCLVDRGRVPSDQFEEADATTNGDVGGFSNEKEAEVVWDVFAIPQLGRAGGCASPDEGGGGLPRGGR